MGKRRHDKRTELFLVRIHLSESPSSKGNRHNHASDAWRGRLQRVVSGETREFSDWQSLQEALTDMLSWQDSQDDESREQP